MDKALENNRWDSNRDGSLCRESFIIQSGFCYAPFFTSSCGRNFEDIDLRFFANCRRRMVIFFYMQHGHLLIIFSRIRKFKKGPILRKMQ